MLSLIGSLVQSMHHNAFMRWKQAGKQRFGVRPKEGAPPRGPSPVMDELLPY